MVVRTKFCFCERLDWVKPPLMVDVGVKGILRKKFDCSHDPNVLFTDVAFIFESL